MHINLVFSHSLVIQSLVILDIMSLYNNCELCLDSRKMIDFLAIKFSDDNKRVLIE